MGLFNRNVFPACAGMIPMSSTDFLRPSGVPRMCGDDPGLHVDHITLHMCSPHVRG